MEARELTVGWQMLNETVVYTRHLSTSGELRLTEVILPDGISH